MKLPKLNQKGVTHILVPLLFIAVFGTIGAIVLIRSNALTPAEGGSLETADEDQVYYATGAIPPPDNVHSAMSLPSNAAARKAPATVDLTEWAAPVKNQGPVNSCVAWAIDYNLVGWYINRYHHVGGMHAPMYTYAQTTKGQNIGTTAPDTFKVAETQGIDTVAHYYHPFTDYKRQPKPSEKINASKYKIRSDFNIFTGVQSYGVAQLLLEIQLASRGPAVIAIPVYKEFDNANSSNSLVGLPGAHNYKHPGYHEVTALGYNSKGLIIENSWGKKWGNKGYATLSWSFVNQYVVQADAINGIFVNK